MCLLILCLMACGNVWRRCCRGGPAGRFRYPGRLPVDDRAALRAIVYVLRKGVSRRDVPAELVGCSGVTAWRRLRDRTEAGVWPRLHEALLAELRAAGLLDLDDASIDASHIRALKGGSHRTFAGRPRPPGEQAPPHRRPARNPTRQLADQRKPSRRHAADASARRDAPHPRASGKATTPAPPTLRRRILVLRH